MIEEFKECKKKELLKNANDLLSSKRFTEIIENVDVKRKRALDLPDMFQQNK